MVAAVAVVAGSVLAAGATTAFMTAVGLALAVGGAYAIMKQAQVKAGDYTAEPSAQTLRSSKAASRYIVGRINTGGVLIWAQEQAGAQDEDEWLHLVYMLSEGEIAGVDQILLDDRNISEYGSRARYEVIINPTTPNAFMLANSPDWRTSMIGRGLSFVRISLSYDPETFPSGIPDAKFIVRGRTDIYDPRTGTSGYTDNCALIALWYLRTVLGVPDDELVMESFIDSANICAEPVLNPGGGGMSQRYTMGAVIGDDERRGDVIAKIEAACGGRISRVGGRWMMRVGAYYGPADYTVTEDMVIGTVSGSVEVDNDSAINTITGTFVDPQGSWAETDYPPVQSAAWLAEDGEELSESLDLRYVTNVYQAQRLADIALRLRRNGGGLSLPMNFNGYNCRPGRVINVNLPTLNISGEFVVTDWSMGVGNACSVTVQPYGPEIYDDEAGREYTPIGFITVPVGGLAPPTDLIWTPDDEPEVRQGVLSWTPPFGEISYYGVIIRNSDNEPIQTYQVPGATSNCQVAGLPAGSYTMSVFARSDTGKSAEATLAVSILGPPQPQSVSVNEGFDVITLIPFNVEGLNGGTYEYFYALSPVADPETAIYLGRGASFTHNGLSFNTTYYYYIRSVNAYGASGFLAATGTTSSDPALILELLTEQIGEGQLAQDLLEEIELISGDGPGSVNERIGDAEDSLSQQISALEAQLAEIIGAPDYDPTESYLEGALVKFDGGLYRAIQDVPAGTPVTDESYWQKVGDYDSIGELVSALAVRMTAAEVNIDTLTGEVTSQGQQISAIDSRVTSAESGISGNAQAISEIQTEVTELDGRVESTVTSLDTLRATIRPERHDGEKADSLRGWYSQALFAEQVTAQVSDDEASVERDQLLQAGIEDTNAALLVEQQVRASADAALAQQVTSLSSRVDNAEGDLSGFSEALDLLETEVTDYGDRIEANATSINTLSATIRPERHDGEKADSLRGWYSQALFAEQVTAQVSDDEASVERDIQLQAAINNTDAIVQQTSQALAQLDGALSASWQVKTQVRSDGRVVQSGVALGASIDPDGTSRSEILLMADTIAFLTKLDGQLHAPFIFDVASDTAFLNSVFIQNGTITNAKIANATIGSAKFQDWLESDTLGPGGVPVLRLNFRTGQIQMNSPVSGGGRMTLTNERIEVFDASNNIRVRLGRLI